MDILIDIILKAGRSAVELSLFVLLPVMVVMLSLMRLLEARGALDWLVARVSPLLRPFGLTGLGVFAALQRPGLLPGGAFAQTGFLIAQDRQHRHRIAAGQFRNQDCYIEIAALGIQRGDLHEVSIGAQGIGKFVGGG